MATYLRPGVFVEESLNPLSNIVSAPGAAVAAFVGTSTNGGPVGPILINSWAQFQALFGGVANSNDDLAYAVYSYFSNNGSPCYVVRGVNADATAASLTINDTQGSPLPSLKLTALAAGVWSSAATSPTRVFVTTIPSTANAGHFDLVVEVGTGNTLAAREQFTDLTMDPNDSRYAIEYVNSPVVGSKYVVAQDMVVAPYSATKNPAAVTKSPLTGGSDGTGSPALDTAATTLLANIDANLIINIPGATGAVVTTVANWAVTGGRHFVVADVPKPAASETAAGSVTAITTYAGTVPKVSQLAVYGPWLYEQDPNSRAGALRLTAPGGAVVGQYVRTDAVRGSWKAPAGTGNSLSGVVQPYVVYTDAQLDTLAGLNVNVIKPIVGNGICIWGARTQAAGYPDKYVPVRRALIEIKANLLALTRFSVFEVNDEDLWALVENTATQYLDGLLAVGGLKGADATSAFYVTCDETNNTDQTVDAGEVHIDVGVALQKPAEFVIIRLGQTAGAATASDSLEE